MAANKTGSMSVLLVTILLGAFFIFIGFVTLEHEPPPWGALKAQGSPQWVQIVVGVLEIAGGVLLFYPPTTWIGAALLAVLMIAGVAVFLCLATMVQAALPALLLISLTSLAYYRFPRKVPPP